MRRSLVVLVAVAMFPCALPAAGKVFDDDWKPPTKTTPPPRAPDATHRRPVPSSAEQEKSRRLFKEVYAQPLANATPAGRLELAHTLLADTQKIADNATDCFVLYIGVLQAAAEGGDLRLCFEAVDLLGERYELDPLPLKVDAVAKANWSAALPTMQTDDFAAAMELIDVLLSNAEDAGATRVIATLRSDTSGDAALLAVVRQRADEVNKTVRSHQKLHQFLDILARSPDDPVANFGAGSFFCFNLGKWERGLPMLANGSDATISSAAKNELTNPADTTGQADVGGKWYDIAMNKDDADPARRAILLHAGQWYRQAQPGARGLLAYLVHKRLEEIDQLNSAPAAEAPPTAAAAPALYLASLKSRVARCSRSRPRTPMPNIAALLEPTTWKANATGFFLAGTLQIGNGDNVHPGPRGTANVTVEPDFRLEGGTLLLSSGILDFQGSPDRPCVLINVSLQCEDNGTVKASNTIFENCKLAKAGGHYWFGGYNSKWEFDHCILHQSNYRDFGRMDYGVKWTGCSVLGCKFPPRHWGYRNQEDPTDDGAALAGNQWSRVFECNFYDCQLEASDFWIMRQCNFYHCKLGDESTTFQSKTDLPIELGIAPGDEAMVAELRAKTTSNGSGQVIYSSVPFRLGPLPSVGAAGRTD